MATQLIELVDKALRDIDNPQVKLSSIIRQSIRIARLRNDFENLWWLEWEMCNVFDKNEQEKILTEIITNFTKERYEKLFKEYYRQWGSEREIYVYDGKKRSHVKKVITKSVMEIETDINTFEDMIIDSKIPEGLHPVDLYFKDEAQKKHIINLREAIKGRKDTLEIIKQRVYTFLLNTEKQLSVGEINETIFEKNRRYVDLKLGKLSPDTLEMLTSAYKRVQDGDQEARSQALLSCRRVLKSLADVVYPPVPGPKICADGEERILTDDKYINRLIQFIHENAESKSSDDLIIAQIEDLSNRLEKLYDLASKGVHAKVSEFEVNQSVVQTYLMIADILSIYDLNNE